MESSPIIACIEIRLDSTKRIGEMIWRRMVSATAAVWWVTPSLSMAQERRLATVQAATSNWRAISFAVLPWAVPSRY